MWDRKISSEEMVQVLKFVEPGTDGKKLAIITPEFLKKRSIKGLKQSVPGDSVEKQTTKNRILVRSPKLSCS